MLTHQPLEGEHARAAVLTGPRRPADAGERAGSAADGSGDGAVGDDPAVAHDHDDAPAVEVRLP
jgi:hypothetical protein